jgi:CheY-like chemotaxis protein/GGDEF domain-containing protein
MADSTTDAMEKTTQGSGHLLLLIDDNAEYLRATKRMLERAGHRVLTAADGASGLELARTEPIELVLVDFMMPGMNGEEFVRELRTFNRTVQVILQTGYASELPPAAMLRKLDVQGYHDKGDGPYKLLLWTDVGLQSARTVRRLEQIRSGLNHILEVAREGAPFEELLQGILQQGSAVLGVGDSCLVVAERGELMISAGIGRFRRGEALGRHLDPEQVESIGKALAERRISSSDGCFALPLPVGELVLGIVHLEEPTNDSIDIQLIQLFAQHASIAIHNAKLHEVVAVDEPTGVYSKKFFEQVLLRELRIGHRMLRPVSVLRVGCRGNGRRPGEISALIVKSTRATDVIGCYGERDFSVALPNTDADGARIVAQRISSLMESEGLTPQISGTSLEPPPEATHHSLTESYFRAVAARVIEGDDHAKMSSMKWPPG